jgi:hypothetical protein
MTDFWLSMGPVRLDRLAEVSGHPAGCVEAHGRVADQRGQVRLQVLELGGADLPRQDVWLLPVIYLTLPELLHVAERTLGAGLLAGLTGGPARQD